MKKARLFSLIILLIGILIVSCSEDKKTNPDTESPTVMITYPPNNAEITSGTIVNIVAGADDNEEVENVKFYINGVNSYEDSTEPYGYSWNTTDLIGPHTIYAKAVDTSDNSETSDVITVTIIEANGNPPNQPSNPYPSDNATSVSTNTDLSWTCTDPDGDPLTYVVYFGISSNPPLVNSGQGSTTYDPGTLNEETTYYWKIVAHDDHANSTTGDIWEFTTRTVYSGDFEWCDVPAGQYTYGQDDEILTIEYDYQIMKYEVTNQQYVDYLEEALNNGDITVTTSTIEGYYEGDENYSSGTYEFYDLDAGDNRIAWIGNNFVIEAGYEEHPVVHITWFGSWAFAEHYGLSLPTEQEWEKAARGNTGYDYPWGDDIDGSRANYSDSGDPWDNGTTPVGMYNGQTIQDFLTTDSPSPFGAYDLAGNVYDWCDSFHELFPSLRVGRGGGWYTSTVGLRSWSSQGGSPDLSADGIGFRCVLP